MVTTCPPRFSILSVRIIAKRRQPALRIPLFSPALLADVAAGLYDGIPRAGGHAARVQVFENRDTEAFGDVEGRAVVEFAADASLPRLEPGEASLRSPSAVRSALAPGEDALCLALLDLDPLQARGQR